MIRDPSDGTVREKPGQNAVLQASNSGLPIDKLKADELARLERSREWIQERAERAETGLRSTTQREG